jgi:hypothetical protein
MRRTTLNYIVDAIFGLMLLIQGISGIILWLVLSDSCRYRGGIGCGVPPTFLFEWRTWIDIHRWVAVASLTMFALHIAIHWQWIVEMTKSYFRQEKV